MLLSGDEKGFDGVYNYLDPSHSLRYVEEFRNTQLAELDELLENATENNPDLRPTIKDFRVKLNIWLSIFSDNDKSQASDRNFLNKQLFGPNPPESSVWRNVNKIVEVLNVVGSTPTYNHMLFSGCGGLDFQLSKRANGEDKYFCLQPNIGKSCMKMDNASDENLAALEAFAVDFIAKNNGLIDEVCEALLQEKRLLDEFLGEEQNGKR